MNVGVWFFVITAVFGFASCDAEIEGIVAQTTPPPRLHSLGFDDASLVLSPDFDPNEFFYTVGINSSGAPINVYALADRAFTVETLFEQPVTPHDGRIAVVAVSDVLGRKENYYIQFQTGALPPAKLSDVTLSVGHVPNFSPATTEYEDIPIPYGVSSVTVFPTGGQIGSFFTYKESATVVLDGSGKGTVQVGVLAENYTKNEYTFSFTREAGAASMLGDAGVSLSSGVLAQPFDPQGASEQTIIVPYGTTGLTVLAVKKNWNDTVLFDTGQPSGGKHFSGPLNGTTFSITVNCGVGFVDKTYQFRIQTAAEGPALLTGLSFTVNSASQPVFQRNVDNGANGAETFAAGANLYNLNFTHGAVAAQIEAVAESGATITVSGVDAPPQPGNAVTVPVDALSSARSPVKLTVSAPGRAANEYTVYFRKSNPPQARLESITITGIKGPQPDITGGAGQFAVETYSNVQFVVVNAEAPADYAYQVRYETNARAQNYLLAPNINSKSVSVYIDGGEDYSESVYTFNFTVLAPFVPRLSTLSVNGNQKIASAGHSNLAYSETVAYSAAATDISFAWTVDAAVVSQVQYSLDYGETASWAPVGTAAYNNTSFLQVGPAESKVALIKVITHDERDAVYHVTVTKDGDGANQLNALSVKQNGGLGDELLAEANAFSAGKYAYSLSVGNNVAAVDIIVSWPGTAALYTAINGAAYAEVSGAGSAAFTAALTPDAVTVVNVQVRPQQQASFAATYTLNITRGAAAVTPVLTNIAITSPASGAVLKQQGGGMTGFAENVYTYTVTLSAVTSATVNISWPAGCVVNYTLGGVSLNAGSASNASITVDNLVAGSPSKALTIVVQRPDGTAALPYTIVFTKQ
ncbi:MAG: hypothetical protein LBD20_05295 [Spirochaetaceae bacterium]|jgi:hypothetical protein|nr:hypothetical protein [Spirochaetaceae bacterium]